MSRISAMPRIAPRLPWARRCLSWIDGAGGHILQRKIAKPTGLAASAWRLELAPLIRYIVIIDPWPNDWAAPSHFQWTSTFQVFLQNRPTGTMGAKFCAFVPLSASSMKGNDYGNGHREVVQQPKGFWFHSAGQRRQGRLRSHQRR